MSTTLEGETGFVNIDNAMAASRAKYAASPNHFAKVEIQPLLPSYEDSEFDERYGMAFARSKSMIAQAMAQLAAPIQAPPELTAAELIDKANGDTWDETYRDADALTGRMNKDNHLLFEEVMGRINDRIESGIALPEDAELPASPISSELEDITELPEDVVRWVRESKARSREQMIRDASLKPVMVIKPTVAPTAELQRTTGVALPSSRPQNQSVTWKEEKREKFARRAAIEEATVICDFENEGRDCSLDFGSTPLNSQTTGVSGMESRERGSKSHWYTLASWDFTIDW